MVHIASDEAVAEKLRLWAGAPRLIIWSDKDRDRQLRRLVARDSLWLWFEDGAPAELLQFLREESLTAGPHFLVTIPPNMKVEQMAALAAAKLLLPNP